MSKQILEGKIEKIFSKDKEEDRYGNTCFVSAKIGENWVGFGAKKKPVINVKRGGEWYQLQEGDTVEVVVETNQKGYLQAKSGDVTVKEANGGTNVGNGSGSSSRSSGDDRLGSVKPNNDDRQDSIVRQSSVNYACAIVAQTLTSKSDRDEAVKEAIRLADEYIFPYAMHGKVPGKEPTVQDMEAERQEQMNQQNHQNQQDNGDFDDDIPF